MPSPSGAQCAFEFPVLIGDIGGTNARFAIIEDAQSQPVDFPIVATTDHADIDDAIRMIVEGSSTQRPRSAILAIAAPVIGDEIRLTNCPWTVRPGRLIDSLGFTEIVVLNDFEAQALAVAALGPEHLEQVGGGPAHPDASRVVLGPGTGLGVAGLVRAGDSWVPVPGEGGHVDLGPRTERESSIFPHIERIDGRVSGEQVLCGRGLVNLYRAIAATDDVATQVASPADVTARAMTGQDRVAVEAVELFATFLARLAGDLGLIFMSKGGVYLSGGIPQRILPALRAPRFRAAFEDKAPHSALMRQMPVFVVTHPLAALTGLAAYASHPQAFHIGITGRHWIAG